LIIVVPSFSQNNAAPLLYQPLIPASASPGGSAFTLTVNGAGFASGAVVNWNGSPRNTTFVSSSQLHATITATDIAQNGTASIIVFNPAPGGGPSNIIYFPVRTAFPGIAAALSSTLGTINGPVAVGDFNGDGRMDIAVGQSNNGQSGTLYLYRGMGNGTFAPPVISPSTEPVVSLMTGDLNGDGHLDLLVGSFGTGLGTGLAIAFLGDGFGHFRQAGTAGAGDFGNPTALADLNGDGHLDLVFSSEVEGDYTTSIFLGNGDGTFTLKTSFLEGFGGATTAIGDFNHDGKLDMANQVITSVDVFLGNGDGTFQPPTTYTLPSQSGGPIAAVDLNGDGNLDLIGPGLWTLLGNGDGTFSTGPGFHAVGGSSLNIGDFNGDGKLDLAMVGTGAAPNPISLAFYLGNGDGSFQPPTTSGAFLLAPPSFVLADFNNDGLMDVAAPGTFSALVGLGTTLSVTPPNMNLGSHKIGTTSKAQPITLTNVDNSNLAITGVNVTGANPGDFLLQKQCRSGLTSGSSCTLNVAFRPTAAGTRTASVSISYQGLDSPQVVLLSAFGFN
jgi:hypothetical protein